MFTIKRSIKPCIYIYFMHIYIHIQYICICAKADNIFTFQMKRVKAFVTICLSLLSIRINCHFAESPQCQHQSNVNQNDWTTLRTLTKHIHSIHTWVQPTRDMCQQISCADWKDNQGADTDRHMQIFQLFTLDIYQTLCCFANHSKIIKYELFFFCFFSFWIDNYGLCCIFTLLHKYAISATQIARRSALHAAAN